MKKTSKSFTAMVTPQDNLAIQILPIKEPKMNPGRFLTMAKGSEGTFQMSPVNGLSEDHIVRIKFAPALPEGVSFGQIHASLIGKQKTEVVHDRDYYERCAQVGLGENELGYIAELHLAIGVINQFRGKSVPDSDTDDVLHQAGFTYQHSVNEKTRVFYRTWGKRGIFSLFVSEDSVHLIFEKKNTTRGWHNLARLSWREEWGTELNKPIIWPTSFADPERTSLMMVLAVADAWDPEQVYPH
jgi:hypothetical protein